MRARILLLGSFAWILGCTGGGDAPAEVPVYSVANPWPTPTDFTGVRVGQLLVTNTAEDTLSVLDANDGRELFRAPMGLFPMQAEGPHHVAATPGGTHLLLPLSNYVPGAGGGPHGAHGNGRVPGFLLKIRGSDLLLEATARLDRSPGDLLLNRDGTTAFVSHYDLVKIQEALAAGGTAQDMASTVAIVDVATMERRHLVPTCAGAHGMALTPDERTLYVACALSDELAVLDLSADPPALTRIPVDGEARLPPNAVHEPYALAMHPEDGTLWVSNLRSQSLRILDMESGTWTPGPVFNGSPMFGAFVGNNRYLVPIRETGELALVDTETRMLARPILALDDTTCVNAHVIELSADQSTGWLVCEGDQQGPGTVVVVDVPPFAVRTFTQVGVFPDAVREVR